MNGAIYERRAKSATRVHEHDYECKRWRKRMKAIRFIVVVGCLQFVLGACEQAMSRIAPPAVVNYVARRTEDMTDFHVTTNDAHKALMAREDFQPISMDDSALYAYAPKDEDVSSCLGKPVALRFAWLSDVQLRQQEIKLYSKKVSEFGDRNIKDSFERNPAEETFDWDVYLALIAAINKTNQSYLARGEPLLRFMAHTGDAIDAGMIEELYQFVTISNLLQVPWLNVLGNHDTSVFGNYNENIVVTRAAAPDFFPVASLRMFLAMHQSQMPDLYAFRGWVPLPKNAIDNETGRGWVTEYTDKDEPSPDVEKVLPPSACHGFDFYDPRGLDGDSVAPTNADCSGLPGYYAVNVLSGASESAVVLLVLQSSRTERWGQGAGFDDKSQVQWINRLAGQLRGKRVLIFSHHRPSEFPRDVRRSLSKIAEHNAVVFFTGHEHTSDVSTVSLAGHRVYDLNTASIISFPQFGRIVEVRGDDLDDGCILTRPLFTSYEKEVLDQSLDADEASRRASACLASVPASERGAKAAIQCGHLGAIADWFKGSKSTAGFSTQDTQELNAVIPFDVPTGGSP